MSTTIGNTLKRIAFAKMTLSMVKSIYLKTPTCADDVTDKVDLDRIMALCHEIDTRNQAQLDDHMKAILNVTVGIS